MPVAFGIGWLVLYCGHTCAMYNYGSLCQQIQEKSSLQIIYTYRLSSYSGHVIAVTAQSASGKSKEQQATIE